MKEDRCRGCYDLRQACPCAMRDRPERVHLRMVQIGSTTQEALRLGLRACSEGRQQRSISQIILPISPVPRELFGCAVSGILFQQDRERAE